MWGGKATLAEARQRVNRTLPVASTSTVADALTSTELPMYFITFSVCMTEVILTLP